MCRRILLEPTTASSDPGIGLSRQGTQFTPEFISAMCLISFIWTLLSRFYIVSRAYLIYGLVEAASRVEWSICVPLQRFAACNVSKSVKTAGNKSTNWEKVNFHKWNLCNGCHPDLMPGEKMIKYCLILNSVKSEGLKVFPCVFQKRDMSDTRSPLILLVRWLTGCFTLSLYSFSFNENHLILDHNHP